MGDEGIGPSTSVLSGQRSATELIARLLNFIKNLKKVKEKRLHKRVQPMTNIGFAAKGKYEEVVKERKSEQWQGNSELRM